MAKIVAYANPPSKCDICGKPINSEFYDFRVPSAGMWGNGCKSCFMLEGGKLGTGFGQHYKLDAATGKFTKIGG